MVATVATVAFHSLVHSISKTEENEIKTTTPSLKVFKQSYCFNLGVNTH